jgi:hypothetical protein
MQKSDLLDFLIKDLYKKIVGLKIKILRDKDNNLRASFPYKQEFLGHFHSRKTEIYTYASSKGMGKIRSSLDSLNLKERINE